MSSNNNELSNVNQSGQQLAPSDKYWSFDSGWRKEADGSEWREKGDADYQKTENETEDGGYEKRESYSSHQSAVWTSGERK